MKEKEIVIIGAGMAGLACGTYLQRNGFKVTIYEKNSNVGGLCTTWDVEGFSFESCLYWVFGTNNKSPFNKIWKELGVMKKVEFINFKEYLRLENSSGDVFSVWSKLDDLIAEMKKIGPEDSIALDVLLSDARKLSGYKMYIDKPKSIYSFNDYIKHMKSILPYLKTIIKYKNLSFEDFVKSLKNEKLRSTLEDLMYFVQNYPMVLLLLIFTYIDERNADYPTCGSLGMANIVKDTFLSLGGKIIFNKEVKEILVNNNNNAIGIKLEGDIVVNSDYVVSCSDGYNTIFNMLKGKYLTKKIIRQYSSLPIFLSYTQFSYGVNINMEKMPQFIIYKLKEPFKLGNEEVKQIRIRHYAFNKKFAPEGSTSLVVTFTSNYDYWNNLYESDKKLYDLEKERIDLEIRKILKKRYKIGDNNIVVNDIATPKTFERYTKNYKGSAEGWYTTASTFDETFEYNLKGLDKFYMASHWTGIHGGITFASLYGRDVAQIICKEEKIDFNGGDI